MARYLEVALRKRNVRAAAVLLEKEAPATCAAVWKALPLEAEVFHAKYANNEIYSQFAPFTGPELELENYTLMPVTGEIMYFRLRPWHQLPRDMHRLQAAGEGASELALFYDRHNLLFSPRLGPIPGNVFARIVTNMDGIAEACYSIWREGGLGERLAFGRLEGSALRELGIENA